MKIEFEMDETNTQHRVYTFIIPLVLTIFLLRFINIMKNYVKRQNLNMGTFSQFGGKNRRNIFTAKETIYYFLFYTFIIFTDNASIVLFQLYRKHLDKNTQFIIHNSIWILTIEGFFGLYVPIKHIFVSRKTLPALWWEAKDSHITQFYVREQEMIPRENVKLVSPIINESVATHETYLSYINILSKSNKKRNKFKWKMRTQLPPINE